MIFEIIISFILLALGFGLGYFFYFMQNQVTISRINRLLIESQEYRDKMKNTYFSQDSVE